MLARPRSALTVGLLASLLAMPAGCQSAPDISDELERYGTLAGSILALSCECPQELGYSNMGECYDTLGDVGPEERACLADVTEGYESEAKEYLDCAVEALEVYEACLDANESCTEGVYEGCAGAYGDAVGACPALPEVIRVPFSACASV